MDSQLADELLRMSAEDRRVRQELLDDGSLFDGYHPRMEEVHRRNAARLRAILDQHGWPGRSLVGERAADAAWEVLQHAIGDPELQRGALPLLQAATEAGEARPAQVAHLEDRIAFFEGRPQRYGTQFDWDDTGRLVPHALENAARVDDWRQAVGLPPLLWEADAGGEQSPADLAEHRRRGLEWARSVGWRE